MEWNQNLQLRSEKRSRSISLRLLKCASVEKKRKNLVVILHYAQLSSKV